MKKTTADETIGAQVRVARQLRRVSLRALSRKIGVSPATLSQIENGRTRLTAVRLGHIAGVLEFEIHQILRMPIDSPNPVGTAHKPSKSLSEVSGTSDWRSYAPLAFDPVLAAALGEFVDIGYHGATVRGIAARCNMSVSGMYHHYPSKQHMLLAILDYSINELLTRSQAARAEGCDSVERFRLLVENLALFHTHRRELGFVGASEIRGLDFQNRQAVAERRSVQQRMLDQEVTEAVTAGHFRIDSPFDASRAVVTMCTALSSWWCPDGPFTSSQISSQYADFALNIMRYNSEARFDSRIGGPRISHDSEPSFRQVSTEKLKR